MKSKAWLYLVVYIAIFTSAFVTAHFLITHSPPKYRSLNMEAVSYAFLAYAIYLFTTPYFFKKIAIMSYGKGILFMCLGMLIAGFFIWLVFGDGNYSSGFYEYEFVSAGLWFGLFNAGFMCFIRFWKSFQAQHKGKG